jgi:2',3'-cyclic-nucleotide 2'-phosphodiesterase
VVRILVIGDIIGKPGRQAIKRFLPGLRKEYEVDMVVANAENCAHGKGITVATAGELLDGGVDVMTSGNHIWAQKEIFPFMDSGELPIIRPLNYPDGVPGRGSLIFRGQVMVVNLIGRTFLGEFDCPFRAVDKLLAEPGLPPVIIVDFHAEATSEKVAMGRYLDGRVSAVVGTHTHVGTIDTRIFAGGTAYVTDLGMTGPGDSIIGDDIDNVLRRFLTSMPHRMMVGSGKPVLNSVLLDIDEGSGRARSIIRVDREAV